MYTTLLFLVFTQTFFPAQAIAIKESASSDDDAFMCNQANDSSDVKIKADQSNITIRCNCQTNPTAPVVWKNEKCHKLIDPDIITEKFVLYMVEPRNLVLYCHQGGCTKRLTVIVVSTQISPALQGFLIFLLISFVVLSSLFIAKKYKSQIYLNCRDTCGSSDMMDSRIFDAYVSIGKNESDQKFVERNITEALQQNYNYNLFVDDENLLPQLEYSDKVQRTMHKCKRLIIVFSAAYMTNDWCMYCFEEGLRKLQELNTSMIFVVSDISIQRELNSFSSLVGHIPKVYLPLVQTKSEKEKNIQKIRLLMPVSRSVPQAQQGLRAPMLSDAEDIDERSIHHESDSYGGTKSTYGRSLVAPIEDDAVIEAMQDANDALEYDDDDGEDPNAIRVNQYQPRKDFLCLTHIDHA